MQIDIIPIGNSKGIRIPKALLEQCGFQTCATLRIEDNNIILSPVKKNREGWAESFKNAKDDEELLMGDFPNDFDEHEWTW
jgi:antitoxin MazE